MLVSPRATFPSNSALAEGLRVKMSSGYLVAASGTDVDLGTIEQVVLAGDTTAAVLSRTQAGVRHFIASTAITQYAAVYAAASGKVAATGTLQLGWAMEAASGSGSVIKVFV